jgi:hypothetical protein
LGQLWLIHDPNYKTIIILWNSNQNKIGSSIIINQILKAKNKKKNIQLKQKSKKVIFKQTKIL